LKGKKEVVRLNIVIPMAGLGSRFSRANYEKPKPFIDVARKPMIVNVLENLAYPNAKYILIARKEHLDAEPELVQMIRKQYNVEFIVIDKLTEGTACTVLFARKHINNSIPLLIANSDQIVDMDIAPFVDECIESGLDGSILTFIDMHKDPKWSFAKLDSNGLVVKVKEKEVISNNATVGIYFFTKGKDFVGSAIDMIIQNERVNGEFYTCPVYNYMIDNGKRVGVYEIEFDKMHGIGIPQDLEDYVELLSKSRGFL